MSVHDRLDPAVLNRELVRPERAWSHVEVVAETGSTNADLAAAARAGAPDGSVLVTDYQSAGKGRLGRVWQAPRGTSLAVSVLVRPPVDPARWTWLPLLTGLAVSDGLRQATDLPAVLKWPNDVLVFDRKICGVLAERVETPTGPACVLGMGLNVSLTPDELPVPTATSVAIAQAQMGVAGAPISRNRLVATVLVSLERILQHWATADDDAAVALGYRERCGTLGRRVRVVLGGDREVEGVAETVDPAGRLVVRTATGTQVFGAGDVVHLR